ncbi:MAG: hypothetical protein IJ783_05595 [Kiritimatiellae bacterium]|nr:hypothetical protein [Kiritimatiellia bacterium]
MNKFLELAVSAAAAAAASAASVTWTGATGDGWWGTAANWSGNALPTPSDYVSVGDGIAINANASTMLPEVLTFGEGSSLVLENNELQFSGASTVQGGSVTANLVAAQSAASSVTLVDCQLTNKSTAHDKGFWRSDGTAHLNFEFGNSGSASYTFQSSLIGSGGVYGTFAAGANPHVKFGGANIASQSEFDEIFAVSSDAEAGTTTISLKTPEGWKASAPTFGEVEDGAVDVSCGVSHFSGGAATISVGCASSDLGPDAAAWAGKVEQVADGVAITTTVTATVALSAGINYVRFFVAYDGGTVASPAAAVRNLVYGDYGELDGVYEYIGTDDDLANPSNWALDKEPLGDGAAVPAAGTDIRWFGRNAVLSLSGNFHLHATDRFVGATIRQADNGNHDSNLGGDVTFEDSDVTLSTVVVQAEPFAISLKNARFATTRAPDGVAGFYPAVPENGVNFVSGFPSSFAFGADPGDVHDAATVKSRLIDQSRITLDGEAISAEVWTEYFSVDVADSTVTVSYSPTVAENRIDEVAVSSTSTSATITATIGARESGALVKFACGTSAPAEADVLAGQTMALVGDEAAASISGLEDLTPYYYLVAIVDAAGAAVLASKAGSFVASDYAHVWIDGAWLGGAVALTSDAQALFFDDFDAVNGDVNVANKAVRGVSFRSGTLTGPGPLAVWSARISNTRSNDLVGAPYGTWNVTAPLFDFRSLSGGGTIRAASSYSFYTTHPDEDVAAEFFDAARPLVLANGVAADRADFTIETNATYGEGEETEYRNVSIVWWEPFPASARDEAWTLEDGARVKLSRNLTAGQLAVPAGADAKIDLAGHDLRVAALVVDGQSLKGGYTAATLPSLLTGEGSLVVTEGPTVLVVR